MATARLNTQRVVIVGAGPAGIRCAETLVAAGFKPILIDENRRDGGQIYRRQPEGFTRDYATLYGTEAAKANDLHQSFDRLRGQIDYRADTLVWNLTPGQLCCVSQGKHSTVDYDALILCTGATDRLMPIEGWQLAGTYSLGGAQIALKSQAVSIGHRVVFMGSGPLLYLVASQYVKAGAKVAAVLDTSPLSKRIGALPKLMARPGLLFTGMKLLAQLYRAKIPVHLGISPLQVLGDAANGVSGVRVRTARGETLTVACDAVALGYHLRPETQLADLAGCRMRFDEASSQWWLAVDEDGRTSVSGVYAAGDGSKNSRCRCRRARRETGGHGAAGGSAATGERRIARRTTARAGGNGSVSSRPGPGVSLAGGASQSVAGHGHRLPLRNDQRGRIACSGPGQRCV